MFVGVNEDRASQLRVLSAITRKYAPLEGDLPLPPRAWAMGWLEDECRALNKLVRDAF